MTLKDAGGCIDTVCVNVQNASGLSVAISAFSNPKCNNACDGSATGTQTGGTNPFTYNWNTLPPQTTATANGLCAGIHLLKITDANGCSDTASITLTQPTALVVIPPSPATLCIGQSVQLTATASGGVPGYTFNWSQPAFSGSPFIVSPLTSTTYTLSATDANGCTSTTQTFAVNVNPPIEVLVSATPDSLCAGNSATLTASGTGGNGNITYLWLPGNQAGPGINASPLTTTSYTVIASDNCGTPTDSANLVLKIFPLPGVSFSVSDTLGCSGMCTLLTNTSPGTQSSTWTFGDGLTATPSATQNHCYPMAGAYSIGLSLTDIHGCKNSALKPNLVHVLAGPEANFSASPQPATILNPIIHFQDQSSNAVTWSWNFGFADSSSINPNPSFSYPDTGQYMVRLIVSNAAGCTDTILKPLLINPDFALYVPNTFTPNDDGLNDIFLPRGMGIETTNYDLYIFDRWGNAVFHSQDFNKGWDGRVNGGSEVAQIDTYVWRITFRDMNKNYHQYTGHVNILK